MADVIKKNTKTLSLKNPTSSSLTKIIKDKLDVDINNIKGSDIPRLFKQGLKFKGILGKRIIDGISSFIKKNPNTKKQYEKFLPDSLKKSIKKDKKIVKTPTNITPKKIKKIDISNIMKNPRTGRGQNLPTKINRNKNTGTNITKRVIEGEVLQSIKKPKNVGNVNRGQTIDGKFQNITPKTNRIGNIRTPNLNVKGIRPKAVVDALDDFPKFKPKEAPANEIKKVKPPKDFTPKVKKPKTAKVIKKELPKLKSNDYTGRFIDKKGDVAYDSFSDFIAHMTGKPKKRKMPKKTARIIGTGDKLKRKDADKKGAGKGVKFKAFKSGTKDKTISQKELDTNAKYKASKAYQSKNMKKVGLMDLIKNPIKSIKKGASDTTKIRKRAKQVASGDPIAEKKYGTGKRTGDIMSYMYPEGVLKFKPDGSVEKPLKSYKRNIKSKNKSGFEVTKKSAGKTVGLKDLPPKSKSPGIHKLPAKAKMNMGFKPMFGGGFISSLYDKPEKTKKHKGNSTSARQIKGYGKARRKA